MSDETPTYSVVDAVTFALAAKPLEFETAMKQILADKQANAVEAHREVVAAKVFPSTATPEAEVEETPTEEEEEKVEGEPTDEKE